MVEAVILGSVGLDTIETPFGKAERTLGGSAVYASLACSLFAKAGIVSVIGTDFPRHYISLLEKKGIDLKGLQKSSRKNFFWHGKYGFDVNAPETLVTEINSLADLNPVLPEDYRKANFLFLGNVSPDIQLSVLSQMKKRPKLVVSDTMNYYINIDRQKVLEVVKKADIALMNDSEARMLFQTPNLLSAVKKILELDSKFAIIKKGEHGAIMLSEKSFFSVSGYPLENVMDPTGCGDCFGGSFVGYIAKTMDLSENNLRKAIVYASCVSSFNAEALGTEKLLCISLDDVASRFEEFKQFAKF